MPAAKLNISANIQLHSSIDTQKPHNTQQNSTEIDDET